MTPMEIPALDDVEAWSGGAILPKGWHEVRVAEVEETTSKTNNHPQAKLKMESPDGSITDWITVTQNSLGRVKQVLLAFGIEIPAGKFGFDWAQLVGRTVKIFVTEEPKGDGSDTWRTVVKSYEPADGSGGATAAGAVAGGGKPEEEDLPF